MFQFNKEEFENWRSQFATSNSDKMGLRRRPYAFTKMREMLTAHTDLKRKIASLEKNTMANLRLSLKL